MLHKTITCTTHRVGGNAAIELHSVCNLAILLVQCMCNTYPQGVIDGKKQITLLLNAWLLVKGVTLHASGHLVADQLQQHSLLNTVNPTEKRGENKVLNSR